MVDANEIDFEHYAITHSMSGTIAASRQFVMDAFIESGMRILDVGCGDGRHLEYLASRIDAADLYGTEISQIRVERVRTKGFQCVKVNGSELPFDDNSFDAIIFFEVIEHVPEVDVGMLLSEMARVLKPGGVVVGSTPNYPVKHYYALRNRVKSRFARLFEIMRNGRQVNRKGTVIHDDNGDCASTKPRQENTDAGKSGWLMQHIKKLFADDPTHQFFCNFNKIYALGLRYFGDVVLYTTFAAQARQIKISSPKRFFSHKIVFVYKNSVFS